jgi:hypothetical protein
MNGAPHAIQTQSHSRRIIPKREPAFWIPVVAAVVTDALDYIGAQPKGPDVFFLRKAEFQQHV